MRKHVTASAEKEIPSAGISQNVNGGIPIEVLSEEEYKKLDETLKRKAGMAKSHVFPDGVIVMKVYGRDLLPVKTKFDEEAVGIKFNEIIKFPVVRKGKKSLYDFALCVGIVSDFYSQPRDRKVIPEYEDDPQYPGYYKDEKSSYHETDPRVCFVPVNSSSGVIFWEWKNTPGNFKKKGFTKIRASVTPAE